MHYPQAQREVHFGTAPFGRGANEGVEEEEEVEENLLEGLGEEGDGSGDAESSAAGAQELVGGTSGEGGFAGEGVRGPRRCCALFPKFYAVFWIGSLHTIVSPPKCARCARSIMLLYPFKNTKMCLNNC